MLSQNRIVVAALILCCLTKVVVVIRVFVESFCRDTCHSAIAGLGLFRLHGVGKFPTPRNFAGC